MRAFDQLGDSVFLGVLVRSVAWSAVCFVALYAAALWGVQHLLHLNGILAWTADALGAVGALLLALWLFLPVAAVIATLYMERIAAAVERRYYPWLPPARGAPIIEQVADGIGLGLKILLLSLLVLVLSLIPGLGLVLGWAVATYGIGRGLFVAVAMRRMPRPAAVALYRRFRLPVLAQGGVMALAAYLPVLNLLIPVIGTAAMVHVLDRALTMAKSPG